MVWHKRRHFNFSPGNLFRYQQYKSWNIYPTIILTKTEWAVAVIPRILLWCWCSCYCCFAFWSVCLRWKTHLKCSIKMMKPAQTLYNLLGYISSIYQAILQRRTSSQIWKMAINHLRSQHGGIMNWGHNFTRWIARILELKCLYDVSILKKYILI